MVTSGLCRSFGHILPCLSLSVIAVTLAVINLVEEFTQTWPGPPPDAADGAGRAIAVGADTGVEAGLVVGVAADAVGAGAVVGAATAA